MRTIKILAFALAGAFVLVPGISSLAQTVLHKDSIIEGATTPESIDARIKATAEAQNASGRTSARFGLYTISWAKDGAEFDALGHNAVLMATVITQTQAELPLKRVYLVTPDGAQTPLRRLNTWRSTIKNDAAAYKTFGKFREDGFYFVPGFAVQRPGQIQIDFAINRVGFVLVHLPTTEQKHAYELREETAGPQPNGAALRSMIGREFPGFSLPNF